VSGGRFLGEAVFRTGVDNTQLRSGIDEARHLVEGLGGQFTNMGSVAGAAMAGLGVAASVAASEVVQELSQAAQDAYQAFLDFDTGIRQIFSLLPDATSQVLGEIRQGVAETSLAVGALPSQVLPAVYDAISSGIPEENVFSYIEQAQKAAIAGVTDLTTASNVLIAVTNAYKSAGLDVVASSDMLFATVNRGVVTFEELAQNLSQVTPLSAALGIGLEEIGGAIATLTLQGTPASRAIIQVRAVLDELNRSGGRATETFQKITGQTFQQFIASGGTFTEALGLLGEEAERQGVTITRFFNRIDSGVAALQLTGPNFEQFVENVEFIASEAGSTERAFEALSEGAQFAMNQLQGAIELVKIEFGEAFAPIVLSTAQLIQRTFIPAALLAGDVLGAITAAFDSLHPALSEVVLGGIGLVAVLGGMTAAFAPLIAAVSVTIATLSPLFAAGGLLSGASATLGMLAIGLTGLLGPISLVVGALVAFGAAYSTNFLGIRDITNQVFGEVFQTLKFFVELALWPVIEGIQLMRDHWGSIMGVLRPVGTFLDLTLGTILRNLGDYITAIARLLRGDFSGAWDSIRAIIQRNIYAAGEIVRGFGTLIRNLGPIIWDALQAVWDRLPEIVSFAWEKGMATVPGLVVAGLSELVPLIQALGAEAVDALIAELEQIPDRAADVVRDGWQFVKDAFFGANPDEPEEVVRSFDGALQALSGTLERVEEMNRRAERSQIGLNESLRDSFETVTVYGPTLAELMGAAGQSAEAWAEQLLSVRGQIRDLTEEQAELIDLQLLEENMLHDISAATGLYVGNLAEARRATFELTDATDMLTEATDELSAAQDYLRGILNPVQAALDEYSRRVREGAILTAEEEYQVRLLAAAKAYLEQQTGDLTIQQGLMAIGMWQGLIPATQDATGAMAGAVQMGTGLHGVLSALSGRVWTVPVNVQVNVSGTVGNVAGAGDEIAPSASAGGGLKIPSIDEILAGAGLGDINEILGIDDTRISGGGGGGGGGGAGGGGGGGGRGAAQDPAKVAADLLKGTFDALQVIIDFIEQSGEVADRVDEDRLREIIEKLLVVGQIGLDGMNRISALYSDAQVEAIAGTSDAVREVFGALGSVITLVTDASELAQIETQSLEGMILQLVSLAEFGVTHMGNAAAKFGGEFLDHAVAYGSAVEAIFAALEAVLESIERLVDVQEISNEQWSTMLQQAEQLIGYGRLIADAYGQSAATWDGTLNPQIVRLSEATQASFDAIEAIFDFAIDLLESQGLLNDAGGQIQASADMLIGIGRAIADAYGAAAATWNRELNPQIEELSAATAASGEALLTVLDLLERFGEFDERLQETQVKIDLSLLMGIAVSIAEAVEEAAQGFPRQVDPRVATFESYAQASFGMLSDTLAFIEQAGNLTAQRIDLKSLAMLSDTLLAVAAAIAAEIRKVAKDFPDQVDPAVDELNRVAGETLDTLGSFGGLVDLIKSLSIQGENAQGEQIVTEFVTPEQIQQMGLTLVGVAVALADAFRLAADELKGRSFAEAKRFAESIAPIIDVIDKAAGAMQTLLDLAEELGVAQRQWQPPRQTIAPRQVGAALPSEQESKKEEQKAATFERAIQVFYEKWLLVLELVSRMAASSADFLVDAETYRDNVLAAVEAIQAGRMALEQLSLPAEPRPPAALTPELEVSVPGAAAGLAMFTRPTVTAIAEQDPEVVLTMPQLRQLVTSTRPHAPDISDGGSPGGEQTIVIPVSLGNEELERFVVSVGDRQVRRRFK